MTAYVVDTTGGKVRGAEIDEGVLAWRGIPYAAPPVGPLRLRLPQPAEPWSGVRDALAYGAPALQPPALIPAGTTSPADAPVLPEPSEDCLYVNVTAPADAEGLPVVLWIHGGGYQVGAGSDIAGDGRTFARRHGVVVVTFNYRLGALGFLAVDGEEHTGAFGLHDQIAALRWVHENIAGFGGDPDRITVYGLSAGAKSVANLLASPLTRGMIHRAASSSGGADHVADRAQDAAVARRFLRALGAGAEHLRKVSAEEILDAQTALGEGVRTTWMWRPSIDGLALTGKPLDAIAAGAAAGVSLLAQTCVNECALYQLLDPDAADQADRVLEEYFGAAARDRILAAYAADRPELAQDPVQLRVDVMTDERYGIPTARLADAQSAHAPVWRSRYDVPLTGLSRSVAPSGTLPAFHGTDDDAVWLGGPGANQRLHDAWGAFVTTGVPTAEGLPDWPAYSTATRATMVFDAAGARTVDDPRGARRAAWDGRVWQSGTWWPLDGSGAQRHS
ncbi:carboxylesterase family protein [Streptomyces sp. NBC_00365]|uniref:carboxylesterase/lipase family protein n=1 Tax=Streptomyces sp. NBC_00365 TaxID=2975726 RepID=UPI0022527EE7|nr:carboxylesterase family protein [Streptomyces sp. NBC_00365]MCX5095432.1 carboxylesterase family protein [Streptomyces sp. NBC_00365]